MPSSSSSNHLPTSYVPGYSPERSPDPSGPRGAIPPAVAPEPGGVPWSRYVDVLRRNALLICAITGVGIAAGAVASRRVGAVYEAQATIWINESSSQQSGPMRAEQLLPSASYVDLLRSFAIIDPVVQRLKLNVFYKTPADSALFRDLSLAASFHPGTY